MEWSGVPKCLQHRGLALLAVAVIVRAFAVVACIEAGALFSDGQVRMAALSGRAARSPASDAGTTLARTFGSLFIRRQVLGM